MHFLENNHINISLLLHKRDVVKYYSIISLSFSLFFLSMYSAQLLDQNCNLRRAQGRYMITTIMSKAPTLKKEILKEIDKLDFNNLNLSEFMKKATTIIKKKEKELSIRQQKSLLALGINKFIERMEIDQKRKRIYKALARSIENLSNYNYGEMYLTDEQLISHHNILLKEMEELKNRTLEEKVINFIEAAANLICSSLPDVPTLSS